MRGTLAGTATAVLLLLLLLVVVVVVSKAVAVDVGGGVDIEAPVDPSTGEPLRPMQEKTMSFTPPTLSEEDTMAVGVPEAMKCDVCVAVAHQLKLAYRHAEGMQPRSRAEKGTTASRK